jgi:hypothetical protein
MKIYLITALISCLASVTFAANQFRNSPYLIGEETYWLTLNDGQSEKGRSWDFSNPAPPPLLPNQVISIVTNILHGQTLADTDWKIRGVTLRQTSSTISSKESTYSYYEIELSECLTKGTPEYEKRMKNGHTKLARIEMAVTMDGAVILPKKGKHMRDVSPELWQEYKKRYGIEQAESTVPVNAAPSASSPVR